MPEKLRLKTFPLAASSATVVDMHTVMGTAVLRADKKDLHPKKRVWGFREPVRHRIRKSASQVAESRRENAATPTTIVLGRWFYLETDPIGLEGGFNLYVYAANNPLGLVDAFGYAPGQQFTSFEAAAIDAIDYSRPLTDSKKVEHCGWILKQLDCDGQEAYFYNAPTPGVSYECPLGWPPADSAKAWYHTHVREQDLPWWVWRDPEKFSSEDAGVCFRTKSTGYLGTPSGHILKMPGTITRSDWESKVERVR